MERVKEMNHIELGKAGEEVVCKYLQKKNYAIVKRNFTCKFGEIDIIAKDKEEMVFIEVKTRCSKKYGEAREAVDKYKKKHIKRAAEFYVMKYRLENKFIRFDVIEVYFREGEFTIHHIYNTMW